MKKIGKIILALILAVGLSFAGFVVGINQKLQVNNTSSKAEGHLQEMEMLKGLIDENFLFDYE